MVTKLTISRSQFQLMRPEWRSGSVWGRFASTGSLMAITLVTMFAVGCFHPIEARAVNRDASKVVAGKTTSGPVKVIKLWVMPNSPRPVADVQALLAPFLAANPGIRVDVTSLDWGAAWTKINTAAMSGEAPDIVQLGTTWVGVVSAMGALAPLNDRISTVGGAAAFLPASWRSSGLMGSGKITTVPWFVDARAVYYRTDVFRKLGISPASIDTWAGFESALKKIKAAKLVIDGEPIAPLGIPGKNDWNVLHNMAPWIWSSGGDLLSPDAKKSALTSRAAVDGIKFFVGLAAKGYVPNECLELNTAQVAANFNDGRFAIIFDTPAQAKNLTIPPEKGGAGGSIAARNFAVTVYPKGPAGRYTFFGGSNLAIFKSSRNQAEAWKVVQYLVSKPAQIKYAQVTGFIPSRKDAFSDKYFTSDPNRRVFVDAIKYGRAYPCISAWGPIEPLLNRHFGIIWDHVAGVYGKFNPSIVDKEMRQTDIEVNQLINDSRK